jgi:nitrogen fixation protein NifU and related proteins
MGQFSETLMDHFNSPRNTGVMENPHLVGLAGTPGNGPFVALYLRLEGKVIRNASFRTHGCGVSIACGSMLTQLIQERSVSECMELTIEHLSEALEGIPASKIHCPVMAIAALKNALNEAKIIDE